MNSTVTPQEIAIVVAANNLSPTLLTPEVLKYSGIVPADWELARSPLYTQQMAQVVFQNGINLSAQADRVMFLEMLNGKADSEVQVADIARKYIEVLQHIEYQGVGINIRGYVSDQQEADGPHQYLLNTLLAPGAWQEFGQEPVRASVNLAYKLEHCRFALSVTEATVQLPDAESLPVVLFSGNFSYDLPQEGDRLGTLSNMISQWRTDLDIYREIINTRFLSQAGVDASASPVLFAMSAV